MKIPRMTKQLLLVLLVELILAVPGSASPTQQDWQFPTTPVEQVQARSLGRAPLLGPVWTRAELASAATKYENRLRQALDIMGQSDATIDEVVRRLKNPTEENVKEVVLRNGTILDTFAWYGWNWAEVYGLHCFGRTELLTGRDEPAWDVQVPIPVGKGETKIVRFVLPKACGNLARWGWKPDVKTPPSELPPPEEILPPPEEQGLVSPPAAAVSSLDKGYEANRGATQSALALYPGLSQSQSQSQAQEAGRRAGTVRVETAWSAAGSAAAAAARGSAAGASQFAGAGGTVVTVDI